LSTSGPPSDRAPKGALSPWGEAVLIGMTVLFLGAAVLWWARSASKADQAAGVPVPTVSEARGSVTMYVGSRACRGCHPGEHASHGTSGHDRTLRPAADTDLARLLDGTSVADPELPGVTWSYALHAGRLTVERAGADEGGKIAIDYALGSGAHATTFVSLSAEGPGGRGGLEHRLSYFAHGKSLGLTPGQHEFSKAGQSPFGYILPPLQTLDCFGCHATQTSSRGPSVLDVATMIPNVSCERCHGPGRSHVEKARGGAPLEALTMPFGPDRWTAESQVRLCGECHRLPEKLKPGSIRPDNPTLARFPSVGLMQSKCYTDSGGALSCTTCHDPHDRVSTDQAAYESACLSCHQGAKQRACSVSPRSGCVSCHMPKRVVGRELSFSDHWIRVRPTGPRKP